MEDCIEKECAWFDESANICVMLSISMSLDIIMDR